MEIVFWAALLLAAAFAIYQFRKQAGRIGDLAASQGAEEERFAEREVRALLADAKGSEDWSAGAVRQAPSLPAEVPREPQSEPQMAPTGPSSAAPALASPPGDPLDALVRKLRSLRVIVDKQGDLPLSVPPHGAIYSLRRGGTAAVLPRFESEAVLAHYAKRFDLVVCPAQDGSVLVMERLEQRLVDLVDDPSGQA